MPCAHAGGPVRHLEELRRELSSRGWITAEPNTAGRYPRLFVQNPEPGAAALRDHVLLAVGSEGGCTFWWPWASRIAPATQVADAADKVTRILRAADGRHALPR